MMFYNATNLFKVAEEVY